MHSFVWLVVAVVMGIVEVASSSLITVWFVVGALAAFVANVLGASLAVQIILFLVVSMLCLALLRPMILKTRRHGQSHEPTTVGQQGIVIEDIDADALTGRVELAGHMTWSALSQDGSVIPAGQPVEVVGQESIKLVVKKSARE